MYREFLSNDQLYLERSRLTKLSVCMAVVFSLAALKGISGGFEKFSAVHLEFVFAYYPRWLTTASEQALTLVVAVYLLAALMLLLRPPAPVPRAGGTRSLFFMLTMPLCYYHLRSLVENPSGFEFYLLAFVIPILMFCLFRLVDSRGISFQHFYSEAVIVFSALFVVANLLAFCFGWGKVAYWVRFLGLTSHPNELGLLMTICAATASYKVSSSSGALRIFWLFVCIGSVFLLIQTGSRASMAAVVLFAAIFFIRSRYLVYRAGIATVVGVAVLFLLFSRPIALERMLDAPLDNRLGAWGGLWNSFLASPILGVGDLTGISGSAYLTALSGCGLIVGSMFIFACVVLAFRAGKIALSWGDWQERPRASDNEFISAVVFIGLLINGFFEATLFDRLSAGMLLGLGSAYALSSVRIGDRLDTDELGIT